MTYPVRPPPPPRGARRARQLQEDVAPAPAPLLPAPYGSHSPGASTVTEVDAGHACTGGEASVARGRGSSPAPVPSDVAEVETAPRSQGGCGTEATVTYPARPPAPSFPRCALDEAAA